jgi:hypothetical protein
MLMVLLRAACAQNYKLASSSLYDYVGHKANKNILCVSFGIGLGTQHIKVIVVYFSEKVKTSLSLKRKHDKDEGPKKRGRPRLIDKEKTKSTPSSTPAISTVSLKILSDLLIIFQQIISSC